MQGTHGHAVHSVDCRLVPACRGGHQDVDGTPMREAREARDLAGLGSGELVDVVSLTAILSVAPGPKSWPAHVPSFVRPGVEVCDVRTMPSDVKF